ncbi:xylan alpha-glucuronosyltransferase [Marchantia polymorpha subsp. ruderalis]
MKSITGAGGRSFEGRRPRQPGHFAEEVESDESFGHRRSPPKRSLSSKALVAADEDEDKYQKAKLFSRKIGILLLFAGAATVLVLLYPGSGNGSETGNPEEQEQQNEFEHNAIFTERSAEGSLPGCTASKSSLRARFMYSSFGTGYSNCDLPKGASVLRWMKSQFPHHGSLKIGLVNIDGEDVRKWTQYTRGWGKVHNFPFRSASSLGLNWSDFYPEWIDEEETDSIPKCPHLPLPSVSSGVKLDVIITRVPGDCGPGTNWRRDIRRFQILLAAATVASQAQSMVVVIISNCRPPLNLFTCDELLKRRDDVWLYLVDFHELQKRLSVPVGSCELAFPLDLHAANSFGTEGGWRSRKSSVRAHREAYATILHSDGLYVCGAIVIAQSIKLTGSQRDLVALVDASITAQQRQGLQDAGWKLQDIERIRNPKSEPQKYNAWNYSKFRLWQLVQYDKIIFIDADLLVLRNLDSLFDLPELSSTGNDKYLFNSGVMVIEPSNCTFNLLMDQIPEVESYNGGDQGFLNEIFPWWHRIPRRMNYLKFFWSNSTEEIIEKNELFQAEPPLLYVIHYLGVKPWLCFRDYDCNWNTEDSRKYASDIGHARWWKVHDSMSPELQQHCMLRTKQKAQLEFTRRQAEAAHFDDEHWKINITDPRLQICNERFCYWESMLWHWGENQTVTLPAAQRKASGARQQHLPS